MVHLPASQGQLIGDGSFYTPFDAAARHMGAGRDGRNGAIVTQGAAFSS